MKRLANLVCGGVLLFSAVGCCCSHGCGATSYYGGYAPSFAPPAGGCPGGNCGVGPYGYAPAGQTSYYTGTVMQAQATPVDGAPVSASITPAGYAYPQTAGLPLESLPTY